MDSMFCYDTPIRCSATVLCFRNLFWRSASVFYYDRHATMFCYAVLLLKWLSALMLCVGTLCYCSITALCVGVLL